MSKVGTKRSDRRWRAPDGTIWASRFEWRVYDELRRSGCEVRPCGERDTVSYTTTVRAGRCVGCSGSDVVQDRSYTPDLAVRPAGEDEEFLLEIKGYMQPSRRAQLRAAIKQHPAMDLRFILERASTKATKKLKLWEYIEKYYKRPWVVWNGELPNAWK